MTLCQQISQISIRHKIETSVEVTLRKQIVALITLLVSCYDVFSLHSYRLISRVQFGSILDIGTK